MLLLSLSAALAGDWFHPGEGPEQVSFEDLRARGLVVGRSGAVLVRAESVEAVQAVTGVGKVLERQNGLLAVYPAAGTDDLDLAGALHGAAGVTYAVPDVLLPLKLHSVPDDPFYVEQWHHDNTGQGGRIAGVDINAPQAWEYATGKGITIAVLDSGVQLDHPDLVVTGGRDYIDADDDANPGEDQNAHGTAAAGVAAGRGNNAYGVAGVAYDADVYAIRLIGGATSLADLYDAFIEATDAGASVLNNSWGYSGCDSPSYATIADMYRYVEDNGRGGLGAITVFAAGNDNCDVETDGLVSYKKLVVVSALEWTDSRASYSNYGDPVDIAAPTSLLTTDIVSGGYGSYGGDDGFADGFSGTSCSAPVVSGVVALMMEANPRITADEVRDALCITATRNDLDFYGYDEDGQNPYYGCGRINAGAAVAYVKNSAPEAPALAGLLAERYADRVILQWSAATDADDDIVGYDIEWWLSTEAEGEHNPDTPELHVDITNKLDVGDVVTWRVRALDVWGESEWSATDTFTVVERPEAQVVTLDEGEDVGGDEAPVKAGGGCATTGGSGAAAALALLAAGMRRR